MALQTVNNIRLFKREYLIKELQNTAAWDVIVIGGGATGLGVALDAAQRGFKTLLLEQSDFAKGTSSRSTKLVHGGVRYLAQGNIKLVYEALQERGLLFRNAPHLVKKQLFVIPAYSLWDKYFYGSGLKIYDWLAGALRLQQTALLSRQELISLLPNIKTAKLTGGIGYYDGQFDDARLALNLAQTCVEQGGTVLNYIKVSSLLKSETGRIIGVRATDLETKTEYCLEARVVVNATGVFVDTILQLDTPALEPLVQPSQGVHIVLNKSFLKGNTALMIPKTTDGRVLFAVPWQNHVLVGTTDTPLPASSLEPKALEPEVDFILETAGKYLVKSPTRADILSVFAGLRPLAAPGKNPASTKEISRSHKLLVASSGLITITGGKWTTYRKMAQDTVDKAIQIGGLPHRVCATAQLKIHGHSLDEDLPEHLKIYGSDAFAIQKLISHQPHLAKKIHPRFPQLRAEVVWTVQNEMARTLEDVLARRLRILFLDAQAAIEMAPQVTALMAGELGYDSAWQEKQVKIFTSLALNYLPAPEKLPALSNKIHHP